MTTTIGHVQYLKILPDRWIVTILRETPTGLGVPPIPPGPPTELFLIWDWGFPPGPRERLTDELSRALAHGLRVRIGHEAYSSYISELVVFAPFETPNI